MFRRLHKLIILSIHLFIVILLTACGKGSAEGKIIVTIGESHAKNSDLVSYDTWRYSTKSELALIDPENPSEKPLILTSGFYSACSPSISYDGTAFLFAAKKGQNDLWQIWEMDLTNLNAKQITSSGENSIDPAYLPGERILFTQQIEKDSVKSGYALFTCNLDGSGLSRITFNPNSYFASTVLKDGRIVTISRQVFPEKSTPSIMVLRPDGTKCELFYGENNGAELTGRVAEMSDGSIYFTEADKIIKGKTNLVSILYRRPLHSKTISPSAETLSFNSVSEYKDSKLLVTARSGSEKFSLYEYDRVKMALDNEVFSSGEGDILDAVEVKAIIRPRKLPSEVDMGVKTGLLLCQNINLSGLQSPESAINLKDADHIEIVGVDSSLGVIKVQKDGSVYLKIAADTPFRIKTMDKDQKVIGGPGSWLYLRPNERRGCVGCHEDQEIAPANRYSLAVGKKPVSVPVHYSGIREKEVDLE